MTDFVDLIERLKMLSDAHSKCIWCEQLEPLCCCSYNHTPQDWIPTQESKMFLEAAIAIEKLYNFAVKFCPKCDGCGKLLLQGGIVEADGVAKKPARIVCIDCKDQNFIKEPSHIESSMRNWILCDGKNILL